MLALAFALALPSSTAVVGGPLVLILHAFRIISHHPRRFPGLDDEVQSMHFGIRSFVCDGCATRGPFDGLGSRE